MKTKSGLLMLSDGDGDVVKALGLVDDMGFGLGVRSQRFALVLKDGVVDHVRRPSTRTHAAAGATPCCC